MYINYERNITVVKICSTFNIKLTILNEQKKYKNNAISFQTFNIKFSEAIIQKKNFIFNSKRP